MSSNDKTNPINIRESFYGSAKLRPNEPSLEKVKGSVEGAGGLKPMPNVPAQKTSPTTDEKKK